MRRKIAEALERVAAAEARANDDARRTERETRARAIAAKEEARQSRIRAGREALARERLQAEALRNELYAFRILSPPPHL